MLAEKMRQIMTSKHKICTAAWQQGLATHGHLPTHDNWVLVSKAAVNSAALSKNPESFHRDTVHWVSWCTDSRDATTNLAWTIPGSIRRCSLLDARQKVVVCCVALFVESSRLSLCV